MQFARIQNLTYVGMEQLTYSQLQTMIRSAEGAIHNTNRKLNERKIGELQGLTYGTIEISYRKFEGNVKYKLMKPLKNYKTNTMLIKKYIVETEV